MEGYTGRFLQLAQLSHFAAVYNENEALIPDILSNEARLPIKAIAQLLDACFVVNYNPYDDLDHLPDYGTPLEGLFSVYDLVKVIDTREDFIINPTIKDAVGVARDPDVNLPSDIAPIWAEAFVLKLKKRIAVPDPKLCEILLSTTVYRAVRMVI